MKQALTADVPVLPVDPLIPLTFLTELYEVLKTYIAGPVTEGSIKVLPFLLWLRPAADQTSPRRTTST